MNKNKLIAIICVAALAIPAFAAAQSAPDTGEQSSTVSAPSTGEQSSTAVSAPSTGEQSTTAVTTPSNGEQSSTSGSVPSTGDQSSTAGPSPAPVAPAQTTSGGGSSSGGSSSSGSYSSGGSYIGYGGSSSGGVATTVAPAGFCPLVTGLMQEGGANEPGAVARLQLFLKQTEGLDVTVNGTFDAQTEAAVKAFQTKYLSEIMGPWGATQPSGIVYITTGKKINSISCNTPLVLSTADLAIINTYKAAEAAGTSDSNAIIGANQASGSVAAVGPSNPSSTSTDILSGNSDVAAAGQTSAWGRFLNFLKKLF